MPFALVFVGLIMIVVGVRNTQAEFGAQVAADFTGEGNFIWWLASLGAVGALGYVPALKKFSIAFMTLIIIAMLIAQQRSGGTGGFFEKFSEALKLGPVAPKSGGDGSSASGGTSDNGALTAGANALGSGIYMETGDSARKNAETTADIVKMFFF